MNIEEVELLLDQFDGKHAWEIIWAHRIELMQKYNEKGKLPNWPLNLEEKEGQVFIRDLMGFLEEEIFEAFEHLEQTELALRKTDLDTNGRIDHLLKFNEEIADTLHLWFEVMIYFNIDLYAIEDYYKTLVKQKVLMPIPEADNYEDILGLALRYGFMVVYANNNITNQTLQLGALNVINMSTQYAIDEQQIPWELLMGGKFISAKVVRESRDYLFDAIKHLQKARNTLKIKYWRNQDDRPNYEALHSNIMEAWLYYVCFLCRNNFQTPEQILHVYLRKHFINIDRLKNEW